MAKGKPTFTTSSLSWLYEQVNIALWASSLALLIVFVIQLPAAYKSSESARLQRADELQRLYHLSCAELGFKEVSVDFQRCIGRLAELAAALGHRMAEDADF